MGLVVETGPKDQVARVVIEKREHLSRLPGHVELLDVDAVDEALRPADAAVV